jgi:hypothetical protein
MRPQGASPQGRASDGERVHLARILWHLIKHRTPYDPTVWQLAEEKLKLKKLHRLHQTAAALGFKLTVAP